MSYYKCFVSELNEDIQETKRILKTVSNCNANQTYNSNHLAILEEVAELLIHLNSTLKDKLDVLRQLKLHTDNAYAHECNRLENMHPKQREMRIGIKETYYNTSDLITKYMRCIDRYSI